MELAEALESVLLGESLQDLHARHQHEALGTDDVREARDRLRQLDRAQRRELQEAATRFLGELCRRLGELHSGDPRVASVLRLWAERSKDYDAFDALLCNFDFVGKPQVLAEGRRLFPGALTAHWGDALS